MSTEITGPFDVWKLYLALKLHFRGDMDYFKYGGKTDSLGIDAYRGRSDRMMFERIFNKYKKDSKRFLLSSFVSFKRFPSELYVYHMLDDVHYEESWKRYQKAENSLSRTFREDLIKIIRKSDGTSLKSAIDGRNGLPTILKMLFVDSINIESYVILNKVVPLDSNYIDTFDVDPRVQKISTVARGYDPFISISSDYIKQIIKDVVELEC